MYLNPYTPGAGLVPGYLAGRESTLNEAKEILAYLSKGKPTRSVIYYGLRGVGKTVLLNRIEYYADENDDILYEHIEVSENGSFKSAISLHCQKLIRQMSSVASAKELAKKALSVLKAFSITYSNDGTDITLSLHDDIEAAVGISDTGNFQNDLTELFISMGMLASKNERAICLFLDEIQYMKDDEFEALIGAIHRVNQKAFPVMLFGAGLPKVTKLAGDIKSYAERLFQFVEIGSLGREAARAALIEPAKEEGVSFESKAVAEILKQTEGYPYFIQEYGKQVWEYIENGVITLASVKAAQTDFIFSLDKSFFKVRFDRATPREKEFMVAMVRCDDLPCTIAQIAKIMDTSTAKIGPIRGQLIHKGFIYSTGHAEVDFTVPQFDQYLKRINEI
ncbi:ATP-binding protein [Aminipila luticellarii]|uniref:ATP-binding protein n=1 Tax=Aminipila luticellarii TaxID=2507160 RepID=A0A410PWN6_9FIRM|nr:ATP-binding protein [Aminipila luticellarii]QAT43286.1 ATP-binding protein [Aminipila luticellarii]